MVRVCRYLCGTSLPAVQKVVAGGKFPVVSIDAQGVKAMQAATGVWTLPNTALYLWTCDGPT